MHKCTHACLHTCIQACMRTYICMALHIFLYMHIHMHAYMCILTHTYSHICIATSRLAQKLPTTSLFVLFCLVLFLFCIVFSISYPQRPSASVRKKEVRPTTASISRRHKKPMNKALTSWRSSWPSSSRSCAWQHPSRPNPFAFAGPRRRCSSHGHHPHRRGQGVCN